MQPTNFADLASAFWGKMRGLEAQANQRDADLRAEAVRMAKERHQTATPSERQIYAIEAELVDNDRERKNLIGKQQFAQRMHDSAALQALIRGHRPSYEITVTGASDQVDQTLRRVPRQPSQ